jgi:hypothetical protein
VVAYWRCGRVRRVREKMLGLLLYRRTILEDFEFNVVLVMCVCVCGRMEEFGEFGSDFESLDGLNTR